MPNAPYMQPAVRFIAAHTGIPEPTIRIVIAGFITWLRFKLMRGQRIHLRRFATFRPHWQKARTGNLNLPRRQGKVHIRGHWRVRFKPSKFLRAIMMKNLPDPTEPQPEQDE